MRMRISYLFLAASCAIAAASPVAADEGGIEINQAAAAVGIDLSDAPGYPIEIYNPGRYRLTGDLSPPGGTDAILVMASDVTLDLMSHQILAGAGPGGAGILSVIGSTLQNVTIRNGGVRGMGGAGIDLVDARQVTLRNLRLAMNGGPGFRVGEQAVVAEVVAAENIGCGGEAGPGARISNSSFHGNQQCGLRTGAGSQLAQLVINDNQIVGLEFEGGGSARGLQVSRNYYLGISLVESSFGGSPPGPGPNDSKPSFELTDLMVSRNGGGPGQAGLRAENVVAKLRNGTFAGNGAGIEAMDSDLTASSVLVSESAGNGITGMMSTLRLDEVTVRRNGSMGGAGVVVAGPAGKLIADELVVHDHDAVGIKAFDVDVRLHDFDVRDNGALSISPGIEFAGSVNNVLSLRRGTLKGNAGPGLRCVPPGTMRVLHSGIEVLDNGGGAIVDCVTTEITPSYCDPPGAGGPGSC
jgi:hypothetical protein